MKRCSGRQARFDVKNFCILLGRHSFDLVQASEKKEGEEKGMTDLGQLTEESSIRAGPHCA